MVKALFFVKKIYFTYVRYRGFSELSFLWHSAERVRLLVEYAHGDCKFAFFLSIALVAESNSLSAS